MSAIRKYSIEVKLCGDCAETISLEIGAEFPYLLMRRGLDNLKYLICERCGREDSTHPDYPEYKKLMDAAYGH